MAVIRLERVQAVVKGLKATFLEELKHYQKPPASTLKVLQAVMYLLGHTKNQANTWAACLEALTLQVLFFVIH
jgi:hypothetical protein